MFGRLSSPAARAAAQLSCGAMRQVAALHSRTAVAHGAVLPAAAAAWGKRAAVPQTAARYMSAAPLPEDAVEASPKVRALVDEISTLTLLEVADLCAVLKKELNIPDAAPMAFAAGPAAAPAEEEDEAPAEAAGPVRVKLTLTGFKDDSKVKVIKEIKSIMTPLDPKFNLAAVRPNHPTAHAHTRTPSSPRSKHPLRRVSPCALTGANVPAAAVRG